MMYKTSKLMSETSKLMVRARAKGAIKVNAALNDPIWVCGSPANQFGGDAVSPPEEARQTL
jgi:hypothetical protein